MSIGTLFLTVAAILFGLYEIGYGFYAYRLNHFAFYVTAGLLIGLPFLAMGVYLILRPDKPPLGWEALLFVVWLSGVAWKAWRKRIARRTRPLEWERWERTMSGSSSDEKG